MWKQLKWRTDAEKLNDLYRESISVQEALTQLGQKYPALLTVRGLLVVPCGEIVDQASWRIEWPATLVQWPLEGLVEDFKHLEDFGPGIQMPKDYHFIQHLFSAQVSSRMDEIIYLSLTIIKGAFDRNGTDEKFIGTHQIDKMWCDRYPVFDGKTFADAEYSEVKLKRRPRTGFTNKSKPPKIQRIYSD